jgi:hypothetical protein
MSGVAVIRYMLSNNATLTAQVDASKIMAGSIPLNTVLPAISIQEISTIERTDVGMNSAGVYITSRVQVTVMTKTYATQKSILELVRKACPNTSGSLNGVAVDSIMPAGAGPDFEDTDATIYMQSRDFIVNFTANRV